MALACSRATPTRQGAFTVKRGLAFAAAALARSFRYEAAWPMKAPTELCGWQSAAEIAIDKKPIIYEKYVKTVVNCNILFLLSTIRRTSKRLESHFLTKPPGKEMAQIHTCLEHSYVLSIQHCLSTSTTGSYYTFPYYSY